MALPVFNIIYLGRAALHARHGALLLFAAVVIVVIALIIFIVIVIFVRTTILVRSTTLLILGGGPDGLQVDISIGWSTKILNH